MHPDTLFLRYPPIPQGPYPPLYEFVSKNWKKPHPDEHKHTAKIDSCEYLNQQTAIVDHSKGLQRTFHDYAVTSTALGTALQELLAQDREDETNSTIAFYSPNHVDYLPTVLAISLMGAKVSQKQLR